MNLEEICNIWVTFEITKIIDANSFPFQSRNSKYGNIEGFCLIFYDFEKLQKLHFKIAIINKGNNFLDCQIQIYALLLCKDLIPFMNDQCINWLNNCHKNYVSRFLGTDNISIFMKKIYSGLDFYSQSHQTSFIFNEIYRGLFKTSFKLDFNISFEVSCHWNRILLFQIKLSKMYDV